MLLSRPADVDPTSRRLLRVVLAANLAFAAGLLAHLAWSFQAHWRSPQGQLRSETVFLADAMEQRWAALQSACDMAIRGLPRRADGQLDLDAARGWLPLIGQQLPWARLELRSDLGSLPEPASSGVTLLPTLVTGPVPETWETPVLCPVPQAANAAVVFQVPLHAILRQLARAGDDGTGVPPIIGVIRADGHVLARVPAPPNAAVLYARPAQGILARTLVAQPQTQGGVIRGWVESANAEFVIAWRRVADGSIAVFVSRPVRQVLLTWLPDLATKLAIWLLLIGVQVMAWRQFQQIQNRQRALLRLRTALAQLSQQSAQASDADRLFQQACALAVQDAGFAAAAVLRLEAESGRAQVLAADGPLPGAGVQVTVADWVRSGGGPGALAFAAPGALPLVVPAAPAAASAAALHWAAVDIDGTEEPGLVLLLGQSAPYTPEAHDELPRFGRELHRGLQRLRLLADERSAHERLERSHELLRVILAEIDTLIGARSEAEVLQSACTRLLETGLFVAAWVAQPEASGALRFITAAGDAASTEAALEPLRLGTTAALAQAWETQKLVRAATTDTVLLEPWLPYGVPGWQMEALVLPLRRAGAPWALMGLVALNGEDVDTAMLPMLERVAELIARALDELDLKHALESERTRQAHLARHDALTGLPNRLALEQELPLALARARRHETLAVVGLMDLDDFKPVNDQWGHAAGDVLLQQLAQRLRAAVRETDFVARLGGDEFVVVFEDVQRDEDIEPLLTRLHGVVEAPFVLDGSITVSVGMSLGFTVYPDDEVEAHELMRHADTALYASKAHKADRTRWWVRWHSGTEAERDGEAQADADVGNAYGPAAQRVLAPLGDEFERWAPELADVLIAHAQSIAALAPLFDGLGPTSRAQHRALLATHIGLVLRPDLLEAEHRQAAERFGAGHTLASVPIRAHLGQIFALEEAIAERVSGCPLRGSERRRIVDIIHRRLAVELEAQSDGAHELQSRYLATLDILEDRLAASLHWADAVRATLATLMELPGMRAGVLYKPDATGAFVPEFTAGTFDDYVRAWQALGRAGVSLQPDSPFGRSPHPRCWHSEHIETNASYDTDPRMAVWRDAAHSVGIYSSAAVPVKDNHGHMLAVLGVYGALPAMFESPWMQRFLRSVALVLERAAARRASTGPQVLSADERRRLRARLVDGGLEMHAQPILDFQSGTVRGVEMLARLRTEQGELLAPGQFLPWFGTSELTRLFTLGLEQTLHWLQLWRRETGADLYASLNLPLEVLLQPDCARWVQAALERSGIEPHRLHLELLETSDFDDEARRDAAVESLAALGVHLVLDDLGSGYSSLLRLRSLPFDIVKIDQGLIHEAQADPVRMVRFIGALVELAHALGKSAVVEGLETADLIAMSAALGADAGQGYAIARPMPASKLAAWIEQWGATVFHTSTADATNPIVAHSRAWSRQRHARAEGTDVASLFMEAN